MFNIKTPAEKLHDKLAKIVAASSDGAMIPEVREAITKGNFVSIELTRDGQESGLLLLKKGEMCLFFAIAIQVVQQKQLMGYSYSSESYDAILSYRNRRTDHGFSKAIYGVGFASLPGFLALTTERMVFLPQEKMANPIELSAKKILSTEVIDNCLLVIRSSDKTYQIYTKYPKMFEMILRNMRKSDRIEMAKDHKTINL